MDASATQTEDPHAPKFNPDAKNLQEYWTVPELLRITKDAGETLELVPANSVLRREGIQNDLNETIFWIEHHQMDAEGFILSNSAREWQRSVHAVVKRHKAYATGIASSSADPGP